MLIASSVFFYIFKWWTLVVEKTNIETKSRRRDKCEAVRPFDISKEDKCLADVYEDDRCFTSNED